jgi:hypothetical protein
MQKVNSCESMPEPNGLPGDTAYCMYLSASWINDCHFRVIFRTDEHPFGLPLVFVSGIC